MSKSKIFILLNLLFFINSIPVTKLTCLRNIKVEPIFPKKPDKLVNSSYIVMIFMKDIGYQDFFGYEYINECIKNYDYNFSNFNSCYIKRNDIIKFTFKKDLKNLDYFLSNNKTQQMEYLFSVDLSKLLPVIKNVTSMNYMFKGCKNLKYINFGNFDGSKVTSMISMFEGCTSLISIKLSHFDTSNVIDVSGIFNNLPSLQLLDISDFNMIKVIKYDNMFNNLSNLRYINIYNVKNDKNKIIHNAFKNSRNLIVCQNEILISNYNATYKCCNFNIEKNDCDISKQTEIISPKQKSIIKNKNINILTDGTFDEKTEIFILGFNYYHITDLVLSIDYYFVTISENNNLNFKYLNFSAKITYGDEMSGNISYQIKEVTCIFENYTTINNKYKIPCFVKLDNTSFSKIGGVHEFKYEPDDFEVIGISPFVNLIHNNTFIVDILNSFEQRIYILEVPLYFKKSIKDKYLNISGVINGSTPNISYDNLKFYFNNENEEESVELLNCSLNNINKNNYTLFCENENQKNIDLQNSVSLINDNNDILLIKFEKEKTDACKSIDFFNGICTPSSDKDTNYTISDYVYNILDDIENGKLNDIFDEAIAENKTYNSSENNITYIISTVSSQYKTNFSTVGLEDCESLLKEKYLLNENEKLILLKLEYHITNSKIPIIEYQLFTKNGTKMSLDYCDNLPQKITIPVNINEKEEFIHNPKSDFYNDKCHIYTSEYDTDLTMYDRKNNYNKKILALCEKNCEYIKYYPGNKKVECNCATKTIFPELAGKVEKDLNLKGLLHQFVDVIKHWNLFLFKCYKVVFSSSGLKKNSGSYINIIILSGTIFCTIFFGVKGYKLYKKRINKIIDKKFENTENIDTDARLHSIMISNVSDINNKNNMSDINIIQNNQNIESNISKINRKLTKPVNIFEINNLDYKQALELDKRSFSELYLSFIKIMQPVYNTFFLENDYNSSIIKICLFLFSFILEYSINALFFNDSTMHKIYDDRGDYNFIYQLPQIIYSFLISLALTKLLSYFILSEEKISKIAETKNTETENKINDLFKKSICKLVIFFIIILLLQILFWYYLSSFCGVYKNTQGALIKDTIISFAISLFIYPYIFCIIPCTMRYCSLRAKNKNRQCLYNTSKKITDILS